MIEKFQRSGIAFHYPANWTLDDEAEGDDWAVTLQTPGTAVLMVTYREETEPAEIADETLEALQEEYEGLESEIAIEKIAGLTAVGHDIDFITLDVPIVVKVRALDTLEGSLLLFWQFSEPERGHYEPLLNAVVTSLTIAAE